MAPESSSRVAAVVVSYNSVSTLPACLDALLAEGEVAEVCVVDNGSRDGSVALLRALAATEPRLGVVVQPSNPGFAAGCNRGAENTSAPFLLFVNPDVVLEAGSINRLLALQSTHPSIGVLSADLRDAQGNRDGAARRMDLSVSRMLRAFGARHALSIPVDTSASVQSVEACSGALMLIPRTVFDALGGWDESYRLHVEDLDFCRRARAAGFGVAVANDVKALHLRGVSGRQRPFFVEWHKHLGLWRYWRKFEGSSAGLALRGTVALALTMRLLLLAWPRALMQRMHG
jgi:GT2 family glycosyltransferase